MGKGDKMIKCGIIGGTSLLAGYLINYLTKHNQVEPVYIDSEHSPGIEINRVHKFIKSETGNRKFQEYNPDFIKSELDVVFVCKPHTQSMKYVREIFNNKVKIIDLSGDFRIKNIGEYEKWYKTKHIAPELVSQSVYGLSEVNRDKIKDAILIANPGCYPTGILLALFPLIKENLIKSEIIHIDSYSGVSGAGKNPKPGKNLFLDAFNNIIPYRITDHQHTPEIEEQINIWSQKKLKVNFVPHITSIENGILNTIFVETKILNEDKIYELYNEFYGDSYFVRVVEYLPEIKDVVDTNLCLINLKYNKRTNTLIITSVIDNRIKGGFGQAIQNMNIMFGLKEEEGLEL